MRWRRTRHPHIPLDCPTCHTSITAVIGDEGPVITLEPCGHRARPVIVSGQLTLSPEFRRGVEQATQAPGELR